MGVGTFHRQRRRRRSFRLAAGSIRKILHILAPVAAAWFAALAAATVLCGIDDLEDAGPMLPLGGDVAIPTHLALGLLLAAAAFLLVTRVVRRVPLARRSFVEGGDGSAKPGAGHAALIARLERCAARDLPTSRRCVLAVAVLGYGFVFGVLALLAATLFGGVPAVLDAEAPSALRVELGLLAIAGAVIAALRVRVPVPDGEPVTRMEAPALFERLDALRARLGGPRLHEVLITEEFNAAIVQRPRLGLLGWPRNHLVIGLPLMQALTPEQLEAVLAHEYGHLVNADGRFAAWVCRMRATWSRLSEDVQRGGSWRGFLFRRFFEWYAPWFAAYSFVLARRSELAADAIAAWATSPRDMADALAAVAVRARQLDSGFWPDLYAGARVGPTPPSVYRALAVALKREPAPGAAEAHLRAALSRDTRPHDTHPALLRRARALGQDVRVPPAPVVAAAEVLLGPSLERLLQRCDARWTARCAAAWRDTHAEAERERRRLAEFDARAATGRLSLEERWCRARLVESVRDDLGAERLYREILETAPDHAPSLFAVARLMLARGDADVGLAHLERAAAADTEAELPACELAAFHLDRLERVREAAAYRQRMAAALCARDEALAERNRIHLHDEVGPARLTAGDVERVRRVLDARTAIARAWLVRKVLRSEAGLQSLILVVAFDGRPRDAGQDELAHALAALRLPGEFWIVPANRANAPLCARARAVPGSAIFARCARPFTGR